jgi:hypothetical protein
MKKCRFILSLITILFIGLLFTSCGNPKSNTDRKIAAAQEQITAQANDQIGLPGIKNFNEKRTLKMIYELRDQEKMVCYAYLWNEFNGKLVYFGKCLGYGIPYATQFSNPEKEIYSGGHQQSFGALPQAEPNGLYMPAAAEGTWLLMLDKDGVSHPVYCEPRCIVSPFKLDL